MIPKGNFFSVMAVCWGLFASCMVLNLYADNLGQESSGNSSVSECSKMKELHGVWISDTEVLHICLSRKDTLILGEEYLIRNVRKDGDVYLVDALEGGYIPRTMSLRLESVVRVRIDFEVSDPEKVYDKVEPVRSLPSSIQGYWVSEKKGVVLRMCDFENINIEQRSTEHYFKIDQIYLYKLPRLSGYDVLLVVSEDYPGRSISLFGRIGASVRRFNMGPEFVKTQCIVDS